MENNNQCLTKQFLLKRLQDDQSFYGHTLECQTVYNLLAQTVHNGESNSALIIGPGRSGKSKLVSAVLYSLYGQDSFLKNAIIIQLDGILDTTDMIALKSITKQMHLEAEVSDKIFGSYAENLAFLLASLKAGNKSESKRVVFILDHFDLFCFHPKQTLLYNLFDIVQSAQAPICVLGMTHRTDVLELLEKRVKSRFSHRQIQLLPGNITFTEKVALFKDFLTIPTNEEIKVKAIEAYTRQNFPWRYFDYNPYYSKFSEEWREAWNKRVDLLFRDVKIITCLERWNDLISNNIGPTKQTLFRLISRLNRTDNKFIKTNDFTMFFEELISADHKFQMCSGLTVLELCLLVAIKHHDEIYDHEPFNFEIILTRLRRFENSCNNRMEKYDRNIALKAFEHMGALQIFVPINTAVAKVQKEFQMHKLLLTIAQIKHVIKNYPSVPTNITEWAASSLI